MNDLTRVFCICGNELDPYLNDPCPTCGCVERYEYDAEDTPRTKSKSKRKAHVHEDTCECDECEETKAQIRELNFD